MIDLTIPGQMTEGELRGVEHLAQKVPAKGVIVEVGSLFGLSSYTWSTSSHPSVSVYCIDPWTREPWVIDLVEKKIPDCPEFSIDAFKHFTRDAKSIIPIQGRSPDDVRDWDRPVDLFFDDAMHTNPTFRKNLKFWLPKMRPGGIMCGHDYCDEWPDVRAEVDRLAEELGVTVHTRQWLWWIVLPERLPRRTWAWLPFR